MPDMLKERVGKRLQSGDCQITTELLSSLHEIHETYIENLKKDKIIIEISKDQCTSMIVSEIIDKIRPFIVNFIQNPPGYLN